MPPSRRRIKRQGQSGEAVSPSEFWGLFSGLRKGLQKIEESRTLTETGRREEANDLRRSTRENMPKVRQAVRDSYEQQIADKKRIADPPVATETLERMSLLSSVYLPRWQRAPGNMLSDAQQFAESGDEAGLRLCREHSALLPLGEGRRELAQAVEETLTEDLAGDEAVQARKEASKLEAELERFELAAEIKQRNMAPLLKEQGPPPAAEPTGATYAQINAPRR